MARKPTGRPVGRPRRNVPCPFAGLGCERLFTSEFQASMHANGAHRIAHPRTELVHGTVAGYRKEIRWKLRTCELCREAWRDYMRGYQRDRVRS